MNLSGVAAILMGVAAAITAVWGVRQNKRGEAKEEVQEAAATKLAERVENYREVSAYADRLEQRLERVQQALDDRDAQHAAEMARLGQEYDRRHDEQAERCRTQLAGAVDTLHVLQRIVRDEIAATSAFDAIDGAERHVELEHPDVEPIHRPEETAP